MFRSRFAVLALLFLVATTLCGCGAVNQVPTLDEKVKAAWSQVLNEYQRRTDLIPNLVETVKGAANFEQKTLTDVVEARAKATQMQVPADITQNPEAFKQFEQNQAQVGGALSRLLVVSENYPNLKSNQSFPSPAEQLEGTENRITVARRDYIEAVQEYNTVLRTIPTRWIAAMLYPDAKVKETFTISDQAQQAPAVKFLMRRLLAIALLLGLLPLAVAAADLKFPPLSGRVVDQTQLLSPPVAQQLDQQLAAFAQRTGDQVVVAIVASLRGVPIEQYGYQLGRTWGIGQKGKDNGVVFLIAPTERKIRIEVGYGLEGTLTDAQSKLIIADVVTPKFKAGQMQQGVIDGVQAILQAIAPDAAGQGAPAAEAQPQDQPAPAHVSFLILLLPIIVVILLARMAGRFPGGSFLSGMLLGSLFGGRGGGGSGGDDNFSGGGGSFGGGGASGDY